MKEITQQTSGGALTIGQLLKSAREKLQLSIDDIADHLRLSNNVVEKIENGQFEKQEITVFIRGYIRIYAKRVSVASEQVENYFLSAGVTDKLQEVSPINFKFEKPSSKSKRHFRWMSLAIITLIVLLALIWSFSQYGDSVNVSSPSSAMSIKTISATTLSNAKNK